MQNTTMLSTAHWFLKKFFGLVCNIGPRLTVFQCFLNRVQTSMYNLASRSQDTTTTMLPLDAGPGKHLPDRWEGCGSRWWHQCCCCCLHKEKTAHTFLMQREVVVQLHTQNQHQCTNSMMIQHKEGRWQCNTVPWRNAAHSPPHPQTRANAMPHTIPPVDNMHAFGCKGETSANAISCQWQCCTKHVPDACEGGEVLHVKKIPPFFVNDFLYQNWQQCHLFQRLTLHQNLVDCF